MYKHIPPASVSSTYGMSKPPIITSYSNAHSITMQGISVPTLSQSIESTASQGCAPWIIGVSTCSSKRDYAKKLEFLDDLNHGPNAVETRLVCSINATHHLQ